VNLHAIPSDLSAPLFRVPVSLNCSIKVFGYQILPLIDFPNPSASGWANLKVMLLSPYKTNKELDKHRWSGFLRKGRRFQFAKRTFVLFFLMFVFFDARRKSSVIHNA